jgi:prevent-host-death family protein
MTSVHGWSYRCPVDRAQCRQSLERNVAAVAPRLRQAATASISRQVVTTMSHMAEDVGVRELRRDLSVYLRRVERGESFAVTSRGRRVAVLGPSPDRRDPLERLVIERHAVPARLDLLDVEPLDLPGGPPLSELLSDVRDDRV